MTAQTPDRLVYEGATESLCTEPLEPYFVMLGQRPRFPQNNTALWRGYVATWEILKDHLYLIQLDVYGGRPTLDSLFPGFGTRVFAHWYSGTLRVPKGKLMKYVHGGYGSVTERDLFLDIERGRIVRKSVRENGHAEPGAPDGYIVGANLITHFDPEDS